MACNHSPPPPQMLILRPSPHVNQYFTLQGAASRVASVVTVVVPPGQEYSSLGEGLCVICPLSLLLSPPNRAMSSGAAPFLPGFVSNRTRPAPKPQSLSASGGIVFEKTRTDAEPVDYTKHIADRGLRAREIPTKVGVRGGCPAAGMAAAVACLVLGLMQGMGLTSLWGQMLGPRAWDGLLVGKGEKVCEGGWRNWGALLCVGGVNPRPTPPPTLRSPPPTLIAALRCSMLCL